MAACESLQPIFDKPLETPITLFDTLSPWKNIKPLNINSSSPFADMFGQLHFPEKTNPVLSSPEPTPRSPATTTINKTNPEKECFSANQIDRHQRSVSTASMNSESLSMCTESLGFESVGDVEDLKNEDEINDQWEERRRSFRTTTKHATAEMLSGESRRWSRTNHAEFPPPISSLGRRVCFNSYRNNGRFILKEVRIPPQEFLHVCREDGRLKLQFIQSDDEAIYEE